MKCRRTERQTLLGSSGSKATRVKEKADMTRKGKGGRMKRRAGGVPAVITRPFP